MLLAFFAGIFVMMLISATWSDARKDLARAKYNQLQIVYTVPLKPKSTILVRNQGAMYRYIKNGYQVQSIDGYRDYYLLVKY